MSAKGDGVSVLKLSDPVGTALKGNAALGGASIEDKIAEKERLADYQKRIQELEKNNANLEEVIERRERQGAKSKAGGSGKTRHVAHAEGWQAVCTAPDFCKVGKDIVAFNSFATLDTKITASANVKARGTAVYRKGDVIKNVKGDAGKHIVSGTSLGSGHVKILDGHENVKVNGIPVARHDSGCLINCDSSGSGGAQGKIVTVQKTVGAGGGSVATNPEAPPGERTSAKLEALRTARAKIADGMLDLNAIDEYVNFKDANQIFDSLIGEISGAAGTTTGYAAQAARGLLGFAKDVVMGVGELAYEGIKAIPKLARLTHTQSGKLLTQVDAQILVENIKLGNISPATVGHTVLDIGKAVVQPVTGPWAKGQYVESVTRGAAEVGALGLGWLTGSKAARTVKALEATPITKASRAEAVARTHDVVDAVKPVGLTLDRVGDGIHVNKAGKPKFSGKWENYRTDGIVKDPMESAEGRRMVIEFQKNGLSYDDAIQETKYLMESSSSLPIANPIEIGDKFYKIVTKNEAVNPTTAYWTTKEELTFLKGMNYDQIADRFGLPLASQQGTIFEVVEITALRPGTSFTAVIAQTSEIGENGTIWSQRAGGIQTLLTNRNIFTSPVVTKIEFP